MAESETKLDLSHRLQVEGRWAEASAFKDSCIREARKMGLTKDEAQKVGWSELARCYPPLTKEQMVEAQRAMLAPEPANMPPAEVKPAEPAPVAPAVEVVPAPPIDDAPPPAAHPAEWGVLPPTAKWEDEVDWVYANYRAIVLKRSTGNVLRLSRARMPAPSEGAVGLLAWAANNETKFFGDLVPRAKRGEGETDPEVVHREKKSLADVEAILDSLEAAT